MHWEQWLYTVPLRVRGFFRQSELDAELEDELRFHFEEKTRQLIAAGFAPAEALRNATLALGSAEQCKEQCRDKRGVRFLQETWQDVRYGARLLRKPLGFSAMAVATLGLVIGANATVFGLLGALLLKPLPYGTPAKQLFLVLEKFETQNLERIPLSAPEVNDVRTSIARVGQAAAFRHTEFDFDGDGTPERVFGAVVSPNLFTSSTLLSSSDAFSPRRMPSEKMKTSPSSAKRSGDGSSPPIRRLSEEISF